MWQTELVQALNQAGTDRALVLDGYASMTGYTKRHLYRVAEKFGFDSERSQRSDKGQLKCGLEEWQLTWVAGILYKTGRENKGPIMPIDEALAIAIDNGIIEEGQITAEHLGVLLRERQMSKQHMKEPTPHTELRSLHPNYCHLVDVSVCIQYYLKNGRMGIMDERDFYKNKLGNVAKIKNKLLRYVLDDHFSGFFPFRYYVADGESRENLWDFLKWSWRGQADPRFPFRGVPFYMLMDAGSAQMSHAMQNFFNSLGIQRPKGRPYNPRRQGAVETVHNIIENRFETRLRICPAFSVEELNAWALDFAIHHHATKTHSRHGKTRMESWLQITPEQLRILPDDDVLNLIYTEPEKEVMVRGYRFTYQGEDFQVSSIPGIHGNGKITVSINPYKWKQEKVLNVVWQNTLYELKAIEKLSSELGGFSTKAAIIGQEYRSLPETETQRKIKAINEMAHGTREPKKGDVPFEGTLVFGHQADKVGNLATLPRRGMPIEIARANVSTAIPVIDLLRELREELGTIPADLNRRIRADFGTSIERKTADDLLEQIRQTGTYTVPADAQLAAL